MVNNSISVVLMLKYMISNFIHTELFSYIFEKREELTIKLLFCHAYLSCCADAYSNCPLNIFLCSNITLFSFIGLGANVVHMLIAWNYNKVKSLYLPDICE